MAWIGHLAAALSREGFFLQWLAPLFPSLTRRQCPVAVATIDPAIAAAATATAATAATATTA